MTITKMKPKTKEITLTLQEAVQLSHKCERTLRSWIKSNKLPAKKVNGAYEIKRSDLAKVTPIPDTVVSDASAGIEQERNVEEYAMLLQRHEQAMFRLGQLESENKQLQDSVKRLPPPEEYVIEKYKLEDIKSKLSQVEQEAQQLKSSLSNVEEVKRALEMEQQQLKMREQQLNDELNFYKQSAWSKIKTMLVGTKT